MDESNWRLQVINKIEAIDNDKDAGTQQLQEPTERNVQYKQTNTQTTELPKQEEKKRKSGERRNNKQNSFTAREEIKGSIKSH